MSETTVLPRGPMRLAVAGATLLVLLSGAAFYYATTVARQRPSAGDAVTVTIAGKACEPNALSVPAGRTTFRIVNQSDRAVEWEILDGVMVVAERENIAPGIAQTLTAKLAPGHYEITCGLLSNPRGSLEVTPSAAAAVEAARPPLMAFIGPLAEYQLYLGLESARLVDVVQALRAAVDAGDLPAARAQYVQARIAYAHLEPMAARFADLATAIDAEADYFELRENDPAFGGLHRLEYGLFGQDSMAGLAPVATSLVADAGSLQARLATLQVPPEQLAEGAAQLTARLAEAKVPHGVDPYARVDLAVFAANLDGSRKVVELLRPLLTKAKPELVAEIDAEFAATTAILDGLRQPDGFVAYDKVSEADRAALGQRLQALADGIGKINAGLGLE